MAVPRARRFLLTLLTLPILFLALLYIASPASRHALSSFLSTSPSQSTPDEIFGLLHFVTSPEEAGRVIRVAGDIVDMDGREMEVSLDEAVVPEKPIDMTWYALGSITKASERMRGTGRGLKSAIARGWDERMKVLDEQYPLVVFSKSYCPYSKRAKKLLESYDLSPPPKVIEVDLRADSSHMKALLTRLTHRGTFPNVILHGQSLGGSDDLVRLHEEDKLKQTLEKGGIKVRWTGEGGEGVIL